MLIEMLPLRNLIPPHRVTDASKVASLATAMQESGWQGRPLLVLPWCGEWQAVTGTHRIAAAHRAALYEAPCVEIDADAYYGAGYDIKDLWDDEAIWRLLNDLGQVDAAALMAAELAEH